MGRSTRRPRARAKGKRTRRTDKVQRVVPLTEVIRHELREFVIAHGRAALLQMLEEDRARLCGPKHRRGLPAGRPRRAGSTESPLVFGGRQVDLPRPRVRQHGQEIWLPTWEAFMDQDPMEDRAYEQMVLGVTTRKYERSLEPVPEPLASKGTSKSAVSRRFVALTQKQLEAQRSSSLAELDLKAIMIDGIGFGDYTVIVALGIAHDGCKYILGLWQGATENAVICQKLLDNLVDRGLCTERSMFFSIDGGKGLAKAIRNTFGARAIIQRCQAHKVRNLVGHLPKEMQAQVRLAMYEAYNSQNYKTAKRRLKALAGRLDADQPDAVASLNEGLDETLTVLRLELPATLAKSLRTTNPIENMNGTLRIVSRNVKRWQNGKMVLRWAAAGLAEAQRGFHRIKGYKAMPSLVAKLEENDVRVDEDLDPKRAAA